MYNKTNAKKNWKISIDMLFVQEGIFGLPKCYKKSKRTRGKIYLLLQRAQIRMEQDINWLLEGKKNVTIGTGENENQSRGLLKGKKWKMEGWQTNIKRRLYTCFAKGSSLFRQTPRLYTRTPSYYGEETGTLFIT